MQAFKGIKSLLMSTLFSYTAADGTNPLWPGIQYAGECQAAWRPALLPAIGIYELSSKFGCAPLLGMTEYVKWDCCNK